MKFLLYMITIYLFAKLVYFIFLFSWFHRNNYILLPVWNAYRQGTNWLPMLTRWRRCLKWQLNKFHSAIIYFIILLPVKWPGMKYFYWVAGKYSRVFK